MVDNICSSLLSKSFQRLQECDIFSLFRIHPYQQGVPAVLRQVILSAGQELQNSEGEYVEIVTFILTMLPFCNVRVSALILRQTLAFRCNTAHIVHSTPSLT